MNIKLSNNLSGLVSNRIPLNDEQKEKIKNYSTYAKTMVAQQISGQGDGVVMNSLQAFSPSLYNAFRLTKGNLLHLPLALAFKDRYFAYRVSKESGKGLTPLETLGVIFEPQLTALAQTAALVKEGKLKLDLASLNPLK